MADALAVCLVYVDADPGLDADPARYDRAGAPARTLLPRAAPAADEARLMLAALRALAGPTRPAPTEALLQLFARRNLEAQRAVLARWVGKLGC